MTEPVELPGGDASKVAYRRDRYGDGRFRFLRFLAGAGQGYALLVEDTWCGGPAVLKGMWWPPSHLRTPGSGAGSAQLERRKAQQEQGMRATWKAVQLTQHAPSVVDVLNEESPSLVAAGMADPEKEYFVVTQFIGLPDTPVRTLKDDIDERRRSDRPYTELELIDLAEQLCGALGALHARRSAKKKAGRSEEYWIHADIKPENVLLLGPPAQYVLIDYDGAVIDGDPIAVTTAAYSPPVPPGYELSPERDKAEELFDIYMLGATLAEAAGLERLDEETRRMLYGDGPQEGRRRIAALERSPIVTTLIVSCLAPPKFRLRTVQSIQADLIRARDGAALASVLTRRTS
ncbi:hypothetical protein [Thermomonospora umbrina]|uniref:Protein kinase domain-containing protein n=1 Tax=Thermomonospora umbrina TaxID=111806 RepID=A0A3D9SXN3_9ACTN|nr:hypothetical protein [Thermomonospora umbrina]REE97765.1 hypothetical protein DFJ69_3240 [Thermomonospora umbrina]